MAVITVVGAGMMGSAIALPAAQNGNEVRLTGTHLDNEIITSLRATGDHPTLKRKLPSVLTYYRIEELQEALDGADVVVSGVSSFGVDWFSEHIIPKIKDGTPVLSVTKGMQLTKDRGLVTFPSYYAHQHPDRELTFNAVGGPCTSYELVDQDQTEVCFCGRDAEVLLSLRSLFETGYYHVSTSLDVTGVEIAVAMKNAYALAVCLAVGMAKKRNSDGHENYNSQAALFGQSIREIGRLLELFGGGADNIVYAAGDLYVTIFGGRTRMIGTLLGEGMRLEEALRSLQGVTLESLVIAARTAKAVRRLISQGRAVGEDFPLMLHIDDVLSSGHNGPIPWDAFEAYAAPDKQERGAAQKGSASQTE